MENKSQTIVLSLKYVLLAILTGVLVGIIDTVFGRGLLTISDFRTGHYLYLIPFLPFAGLLITWLYHHFSETSLKGMTLVFETGQKKREDIPLLLIPLVMSGTWITHLFGGSAGREGVAVQIGAALSHALGRRFHLPKDSRVMLITGMAAGFGGLFQTPLTAVFFSMEVIVAGKIQYEALLPALIASYIAAYTSHTLGLEKFYVPLKDIRCWYGCPAHCAWNHFWTDRTAVFVSACKIKKVFRRKNQKSIFQDRCYFHPVSTDFVSALQRKIQRTWNQSDLGSIFWQNDLLL